MKKLLIIGMVFVGGLAVFYFWPAVPTSNGNSSEGSANFRPNPSNAAFVFEDGPIKLSDGRSEQVKFGLVEETGIFGEPVYGDLNSDGKEDAAVLLVRSSGISGVFVYTAAYVSGPVGYRGTKAVFIGDRVSPESISISNGAVTVDYLDRAENEPFAAEPTVSTSKQFVYRNGKFEER